MACHPAHSNFLFIVSKHQFSSELTSLLCLRFDQTFLNLGYHYEFFFSRFKDIDNHTNRGNHVANIGIGFVWGGSRTAKNP